MKIKNLLLIAAAASLSLSAFAQELSTGEGAYLANGDPAMGGQATKDHFFVKGTYNDMGEAKEYTNKVSFKSGDTQLVWFYLDDDEIYLNEAVQALPPIAINAAGELYNEITYNSFQFEVYLPENIDIVTTEDEESGEEIDHVQGDRLPTNATFVLGGPKMKEDAPAEIAYKEIDGKNYKVYSIVSYNANAYGSHLSAKNANLYKRNGALKKDATVFGLYMKNNNQETVEGQVDDIILGNMIMNVREAAIAEWDSNQSTFFYGEGGNNESQRFMMYNRVNTWGSASVVENLAEKTINNVKYYNVAGMQSNVPFDGVNIKVVTYNDGTTSTTKVIK